MLAEKHKGGKPMQTTPRRFPRIAFFGVLCFVAASARAQNTTVATAAHLTIGQIPDYFSLANNTTDQRWYDFTAGPVVRIASA